MLLGPSFSAQMAKDPNILPFFPAPYLKSFEP